MITQEQTERIARQIAGCQQDAGWELVEFPPGRILTEWPPKGGRCSSPRTL
jgi:hypothetical protein